MKNPSNWLQNALITLRELDLKERAIQVQILELLLEVERRKAYAELGFDGLFSFCVKALGYSEAQSFQRIQAMQAMRSVPQVKEKIESGKLNLTAIAQVQVMIRQERIQEGIHRTAEQKLKLFESFEGKTTRQVKEKIAEIRGEKIKLKLTLELDQEAEDLWKQVKAKVAHSTHGNDLLCLKTLMKAWLTAKEKDQSFVAQDSTLRHGISGSLKVKAMLPMESRSSAAQTTAAASPAAAVPISIRRAIFARDQYRCQNCNSHYALQIDHIQPRAKGGSHSPQNLRVLCRNCNLHFAVKELGIASIRR